MPRRKAARAAPSPAAAPLPIADVRTDWELPNGATVAVWPNRGRYIVLDLPASGSSVDGLSHVAVFGFAEVLRAGAYAEPFLRRTLGATVAREVAQAVRTVEELELCRCRVGFADAADHGWLSVLGESSGEPTRYGCRACGRAWLRHRDGAWRAEPEAALDRCGWSWQSRFGGTPWDCVERRDLDVTADGVAYTEFDESSNPGSSRRASWVEFLQPDCAVRAELPKPVLAAAEAECRRRQRHAARRRV